MSCDQSWIRRGKMPVLAFGISLSAFIPASGAFACGGIYPQLFSKSICAQVLTSRSDVRSKPRKVRAKMPQALPS